MTSATPFPAPSPGPVPDPIDIERLLGDRLTPVRTAGLVALAGVGSAEAVLLSVMLATEPTPLPATTTVALALIAAAGLAWAVFAIWRLTTHQVLLLRDRVVGAALASVFSTIAAIGSVAVSVARGNGTVAAGMAVGGATMITAALLVLRRAIVDHRRARRRLEALTSQP